MHLHFPFLFLPHQFLPPSLFFCRRPGPKRRPVKRRIPRSELEDIVDVYKRASSCQKALLFLLPFFLLLCRCSISLMKRRRRNRMRKRVGRHMMGDNLYVDVFFVRTLRDLLFFLSLINEVRIELMEERPETPNRFGLSFLLPFIPLEMRFFRCQSSHRCFSYCQSPPIVICSTRDTEGKLKERIPPIPPLPTVAAQKNFFVLCAPTKGLSNRVSCWRTLSPRGRDVY